jgi:hypothetical protein
MKPKNSEKACPSACIILNKNSVAKEKINAAVSNGELIMNLDHLSCLQAITIALFLISGNMWAIVYKILHRFQ